MAWLENDEREEIKSPFGRVYLRPETEQVINCALGLKHAVDISTLKSVLSNSMLVKHPRFCSLLVRDRKGRGHWQRTRVNIDDHVTLRHHRLPPRILEHAEAEEVINEYLADLSVSLLLSEDKPLWEVHVLERLNCVVLRVHHTIGDGLSLMSLLSACFDLAIESSRDERQKESTSDGKRRKWRNTRIWGFIKTVWLTIVYVVGFAARVFLVKDKTSVISGGDGVEMWPRKLVTAKFKLEDMKAIKKAIPNATTNDVLLGVITCGLSKYLAVHSPKALLQNVDATALLAVNLRTHSGIQEMAKMMDKNSGAAWGNKMGLFFVPLRCNKEGLQHPLRHVTRAKGIMDLKKQSYEAHALHFFLSLISSLFGPKGASWISRRILMRTTLLVSNIVGPPKDIAVAGIPVTFLRVNISSLPHAMTMHMVSYKGRACE